MYDRPVPNDGGNSFVAVMLLIFLAILAFSGMNAFFDWDMSSAEAANCANPYRAQQGDTPASIATRFGVSETALIEANPTLRIAIAPGLALCIPGNAPARAALPANPAAASGGIPEGQPAASVPPPVVAQAVAPTPLPGPCAYGAGRQPTLTVLDVDPGEDVTVGGVFLPPGEPLNVQIGPVGGAADPVGSFTMEQDCSFIRTFPLPPSQPVSDTLQVGVSDPQRGINLAAGFENASAPNDDRSDYLLQAGAPLPGRPVNPQIVPVPRSQPVSLASGDAGVLLTQDAYDQASLAIARLDPLAAPSPNLTFLLPLLQVELVDAANQPLPSLPQPGFVYFDLSAEVLRQYSAQGLDLFVLDPARKVWERCDVRLPVNIANPVPTRVACQVQRLGVFGVAIEK